MLPPNTMGSPQNNFNTMQPNQPTQPRNMMLANALQNYGTGNPTQQYAQQADQNYSMPGGQGNKPFGFNAYAQGMNKSTNMQPQLPQPLQSQSVQY
jgi:hypothetical protein